MTTEVKLLLKNSVKYDIVLGICISIILYCFFGTNISLIYLFGLAVSIANFLVSGIILDKNLNGVTTIPKIICPLSYIIRIVCVALFAMLFAKNLFYLLTYLGGFISHFPIIIFSWIRSRKGSE